jgi:ferric-dicitrate binding protein FerR (iron transport regulator)
MNDKKLHISLNEESAGFFSKGKIVWDKPEAKIWDELLAKTQKTVPVKTVSLVPRVLKYSAAAVLFLLVGLGAVTLLYHKTIESLPGEHITAQLPDGSAIEMNAGSYVKYYPFQWPFERKVVFEGEGFFSVQKGKKFEVESANGSTQVLGTTFNIYSRDGKYRVTCLTGRVKVVSKADESVVLEPDSHAEIEEGKLILNKNYKTEKALGWKNNQFFFAGTPLKEVIDEIERQYGVTIKMQAGLSERNFVGNFQRKYNVEEVLDFVCKTMQIEFVKQSENVFLVVEKS